MEKILLREEQIKREGKLMIPLVENYNSLYFHILTKSYDTSYYPKWGKELIQICEKKNCDVYYLIYGTKTIYVYPDKIIEDWFMDNIDKFFTYKKRDE